MLEPTFILMYYGGFTYTEIYSLPISYKKWFIDRLVTELSKKDAPTKAAHADTPDVREMQGRMRNQMPARLRRFT